MAEARHRPAAELRLAPAARGPVRWVAGRRCRIARLGLLGAVRGLAVLRLGTVARLATPLLLSHTATLMALRRGLRR